MYVGKTAEKNLLEEVAEDLGPGEIALGPIGAFLGESFDRFRHSEAKLGQAL